MAQTGFTALKAGGTGHDYGYAVATDASGNIYVTGYFEGTATFGSTSLTSSGRTDIFVWKLNSRGVHQWAKNAGGAGYDYGNDIAVDGSGGVYVVGNFRGTATFGSASLTSGDVFVWKLNSSGAHQWVKKAGGPSGASGGGIALDGSGNVYVVGDFQGKAGFGSPLPQDSLTSSGEGDIFVWKLNSNGTYQWAKQAGGTSDEGGFGVALDGSGDVYVVGNFRGTATFGSASFTSSGGRDIFVWKLSSSGVPQWAKKAGGESRYDYGYAVATDDSGGVYVTGAFGAKAGFGSPLPQDSLTSSGNVDAFVWKLNSEGTYQWAKKAGGTNTYFAYGTVVAVDGSGNVYVTGGFTGKAGFGSPLPQDSLTSKWNYDIFVWKLNRSGSYQWAKKADGTRAENSYGIAVDGSGNVYVTGHFREKVTFGTTTLTTSGFNDIFVWRAVQKNTPNLLQMPPRPTLNIYPNPTKDKIRIMGLKEGDRIRLLNATGEVLIQDLHPTVPLNLNHLPTGSYILEVTRPHYPSLRHKLLKRP